VVSSIGRARILLLACSSDTKDGGLEFGLNRMPGWMSFTQEVRCRLGVV